MTWDRISEYLKELINTTKDQWIWFIDDQIDVLEGKREHFYGKTQKAYVIDSDEADKRLAEWQKTQWDKVSVNGRQMQNSAQTVSNGAGFSYNKDPASRNWQFRSD